LNLSFFISKRYLFAKKSSNLINVISLLSVIGVSVMTMALVVILSVFNGFDSLIKTFYYAIDPDFRITIAEGKVFSVNDSIVQKIKTFDEIKWFTEVLEENAMLDYDNKQDIATIMGVSDNFKQATGIDTMMTSGEFTLKDEHGEYASIGYALAKRLGVNLNLIKPVKVLVPRRNVMPNPTNLRNAFMTRQIFPLGIFNVLQEEYDEGTIIVPIKFARELLEYKDEVSSIDLKLKVNINHAEFQQKLERILGKRFIVLNRFQQHEFLFKVMQSEKWAIFLILSFILIIASFNLTGSLTMLIIDKKQDIIILQNMGASKSLIRNIFLFEGWFISIFGALIGLILGALICYIQIKFGIIDFPESFIIQNYPVEMQLVDFIYVFFTVIFIGFLASWYPVRYITKKHILV
jgi:lipoprotein-releasing system permease protein